jgi:tripartite-type tricarboxylate transporter receptor subunit TctC
MQSQHHSVRLATLALFLIAPAVAAHAQTYPAKPIRIVAASSPGSAVDIVARVVGQKLSESVGQQVLVDNRAGAGGNLGAEVAARAAPDGYTLFMGTPAHAISAAMGTKTTYDLQRDFAPISLLTTGHYILVLHPNVPARSVKELIALAKAQPGKLNYASAGQGNATHLAGELFNILAGVKMVHVPYKGGGPAKADLMGGQVDLMFSNITAAINEVQTGKLRGLAVTGPKRSLAAPNLPTIAEAGLPGYEITSWFGVLAPAATPPEVVARLNKELVRVVQLADVRERLGTQGSEALGTSPQEFGKHIQSEIARWSKVIKAAGIKPE